MGEGVGESGRRKDAGWWMPVEVWAKAEQLGPKRGSNFLMGVAHFIFTGEVIEFDSKGARDAFDGFFGRLSASREMMIAKGGRNGAILDAVKTHGLSDGLLTALVRYSDENLESFGRNQEEKSSFFEG